MTLVMNVPTATVTTSGGHWETMTDDPYAQTGTPAPSPARIQVQESRDRARAERDADERAAERR